MTCTVTSGRPVGGERQWPSDRAENVVALRAGGPAKGNTGIPAQPGAANSPACAAILLVLTIFDHPEFGCDQEDQENCHACLYGCQQDVSYQAQLLSFFILITGGAAAPRSIARLVAEMRPIGSVLEIARGTGLWTEALAAGAETVTAIDAAPETVAIARDRVPSASVSFEVGDVFSWDPGTRFDVVFFSAWLSHFPASRFRQFWQLLGSLLAGHGRVLFIDEHVDERGKDAYVAGLDEIVERRLRGASWDCAIRRDGSDWGAAPEPGQLTRPAACTPTMRFWAFPRR